MKNFSRLQQKFRRQGIGVSWNDGVYSVENEHARATILLPEDFLLEEKAVSQLLAFAAVGTPSHPQGVCQACATPDFHPGSTVPVGAVVATPSDVAIPAAIGTDINCGMRLITTGITKSQAALRKPELVSRLKRLLLESARDLPMTGAGYARLFDAPLADFLGGLPDKGMWQRVDRDALVEELGACIGLARFAGHSRYAPAALLADRELRDPCLGTPGSGNHFVELQEVEEIYDRKAAWEHGLKVGDLVVMIHSGSRDVGFYVGGRFMDRAKEAWPRGMKHPGSGLYGLEGELAREYLIAMGTAARYAWFNRVALGEMVKSALEDTLGLTAARLVVDVPHNVVLEEYGLNIHRKGATPAHAGDLAIIPGSMGTASYLAHGRGSPEWLYSCSHGAGRVMRRQEARRAATREGTTWECVTLREERRIEEAPEAYKDIGPVIAIQEEHGLIASIARFRPWVTFKA